MENISKHLTWYNQRIKLIIKNTYVIPKSFESLLALLEKTLNALKHFPNITFIEEIDGNKSKGRIPKRVLRACAYQGLRNVRFSENLNKVFFHALRERLMYFIYFKQ